jgi:hypothetical protein
MKSESAKEPKNRQHDQHRPEGSMETKSGAAEKHENDHDQQ